MHYPQPLKEAVLLKRHFRFLAEVILNNNKRRMLYCPTLSALPACEELGARLWYSPLTRLSEGYLDVVEMAETEEGALIQVNTRTTALCVQEAIEHGHIPELSGFRFLQPLQDQGLEKSIHLLLKEDGTLCFLHIVPILNAVSLGKGILPPIEAGVLKELIDLRKNHYKTVLLYCVQNTHIHSLSFEEKEPFKSLFKEALQNRVEILAYKAHISLQEIALAHRVPILPGQIGINPNL